MVKTSIIYIGTSDRYIRNRFADCFTPWLTGLSVFVRISREEKGCIRNERVYIHEYTMDEYMVHDCNDVLTVIR